MIVRRFALAALIFASTWLGLGVPVQAAIRLPNSAPFVRNEGEYVAAVVMTAGGKQVLYSYNPDLPHPAASLTKLANAQAFLTRNIAMTKRVSLLSKDEVGGGRLRVSSGASMTVQDMFYSSITASANNTAVALGRLSGLSAAAFLKLMNEQAKLDGATSTRFYDFAGMDPRNMTTARDMALIADKTFSTRAIQRAASTAKYSFTVQSGKSKIFKTITNTNHLLTVDPDMWVIGGKTGYLEESKNNLVVRLRRLDEHGKPMLGADIIVVVFGSDTTNAMFATAKRLALWTWDTHAF